jgi:calcineurin-like phosphoesterase family protein
MARIFVVSDTHFAHPNIVKFEDETGELIRGKFWSTAEEHDEAIIANWNETVEDSDHVYHLGDVAMNKRGLECVKRLKGRKRLVHGNHDIFPTKLLMEAGFEKIYGVRVFEKHNLMMTHIPIHPDSLKQGWVNYHGHLHHNWVMNPGYPRLRDFRYQCVSLEHTDYRPKLLLET